MLSSPYPQQLDITLFSDDIDILNDYILNSFTYFIYLLLYSNFMSYLDFKPFLSIYLPDRTIIVYSASLGAKIPGHKPKLIREDKKFPLPEWKDRIFQSYVSDEYIYGCKIWYLSLCTSRIDPITSVPPNLRINLFL